MSLVDAVIVAVVVVGGGDLISFELRGSSLTGYFYHLLIDYYNHAVVRCPS